ncbi:MAG: hypothetical protein OWU84_12025 [Firmicutes bacterium]|nr:hypothetical protein [Bacillota bacterium]
MRRRFLAGLGFLVGFGFLTTACGSAPVVATPPPVSLISRIPGRPTSVFEVGRHPWVAVLTARGLVVQQIGSHQRAQVLTPRSSFACVGSGRFQELGSDLVVTGCRSVWLLEHHRWRKSSLPGLMSSLAGTTYQWWALAYGAAAGDLQQVTLWRSQNDGATWQRVARSALRPSALPEAEIKTGLGLASSGDLWLTGILFGEGHIQIFHGTENGTRWQPLQLSVPHAWSEAELEPYPPISLGRLTYLPVLVEGPQQALALYRKSDTSPSWTLYGALMSPIESAPWSLALASARTLWVAVGRTLWVSRDRGRKWTRVWRLPLGWQWIAVTFSTPRNGTVLAVRWEAHANAAFGPARAYALWTTADAGATWQTVTSAMLSRP